MLNTHWIVRLCSDRLTLSEIERVLDVCRGKLKPSTLIHVCSLGVVYLVLYFSRVDAKRLIGLF